MNVQQATKPATDAVSPIARQIDIEAKNKARLAFLSYQQAVIDGDKELAEAAKTRFLKVARTLAAGGTK